MVIDDNTDAADTLADMVRLWGHDVDIAYDGLTGVLAAMWFVADAVLCDIGLPDIDGYEVATRLRRVLGQRLLLVAVSGYARPEDVRRCTAAGFDFFLPKPPDPHALKAVLSAWQVPTQS